MPLASPATKVTQKILVSALFAGALAGLMAGLLQLMFVQPVLLHAELYEGGDLVHFGGTLVSASPDLPGFDPLRDGLSLVFTMLTYTGYALLLVAAMSFADDRGFGVDARTGIIWGVAGFVAFHLAPGISLAPEVPGVSAADIGARQVWWFATVIAAVVALGLIAFGKGWAAWGVAIILLMAPHLVGAPEPATFAGTTPPEIAGLFAARAFGVGLAAWVILGSAAGFFWRRETLRTA
jgi:cobalt transporter subunit CbtA